jgi:hypothetical protein
MGKFDYLNNEVIKMFNLNSNNSNIARDLLPNGNDLEISSLRKHISRLRNNEGVLNACTNLGVDPTTTPMLWLKNKMKV